MLSLFKSESDAKALVKMLNSVTRRTMSNVIGNSSHAKYKLTFSDLLNPTEGRNPHLTLIKGSTKGVLEKPSVMEPLAMYLTLCKVLDWFYASEERSTPIIRPPTQERFPRTNEFYFEGKWEHMQSLQKLLSKVSSCIALCVDLDWEEDVARGSGKEVAISSSLAAGILKCKAVKDAQNPLSNFLSAALQLNMFHKTGIQSEATPNTVSKRLRMDEIFVKYGDPTKKDKLYGPLSAAVLIDPVFLFVPYLIAETSPCLQEFVIACKTLGSSRPPLIEAVNVKLFKVIRGLANGSIKSRELPEQLLEVLESQDLKDIYKSTELDEWYKAKGHIVRYNGNKRNTAPVLWESYVKDSSGPSKRKRGEEKVSGKPPPPKRAKAGLAQGELPPPQAPAFVPPVNATESAAVLPARTQGRILVPLVSPEVIMGVSNTTESASGTGAVPPPITPPPSPGASANNEEVRDVQSQANGDLPSPSTVQVHKPLTRGAPRYRAPSQYVRTPIRLPQQSFEKLKRLRPVQHYEVFEEHRQHSKFPGTALRVEDRDGVFKECKPVFSNREGREFWNERVKDILSVHSQDSDVFNRVEVRAFSESSLSKRESYLSHCVLLKDVPEPTASLSLADAVATCGSLDSPRVVHDLCLPVGNNYNNKQRLITLNEFLKIARDPNDHRALNILDIPDVVHDAPMTFDMVRVAWGSVSLLSFFSKSPFPQGHFTWKLAATTGAMHGLHIDAEGLATEINVLTGEKVWGVVYDARQPLPSTLIQEARPLQTFGAKLPKGYVAKAVRLTANTRFFLPPGVIHFVATTESSVCTGGHMYTWGTMAQTLWSLIHVRIRDQSTNTEHGVWSEALVRIVAFFHEQYMLGKCPQNEHLPLLESASDWENLCALFVIMELLNVLSRETYKCSAGLQARMERLNADKKGKSSARSFSQAKKLLDIELKLERDNDVNGLSDYQRMMFVGGRGLAQHCVNSLVNESNGRTFRDDLFVPMMASTVFHFRKAFELSVDNDVDPFWQASDVRQLFFQQLDCVLERHGDVKDAYDLLNKGVFDWEKADMKGQYDVPTTGYQVHESVFDFAEEQAFPLGVSSRDVLWLDRVEIVGSDEGEGERPMSEDQED